MNHLIMSTSCLDDEAGARVVTRGIHGGGSGRLDLDRFGCGWEDPGKSLTVLIVRGRSEPC